MKLLFIFLFFVSNSVDYTIVHSFYSSRKIGLFIDDLIISFWFSRVASFVDLIV